MQTIQELASLLKLTYTRDNAEDLIKQAQRTGQDMHSFLTMLLTAETERRAGNGNTRRIREAHFPIKKYLVDFDRGRYDAAFLPKFQELETLKFIENKENIILIGTSGAAQTALQIRERNLICSEAAVAAVDAPAAAPVFVIYGFTDRYICNLLCDCIVQANDVVFL